MALCHRLHGNEEFDNLRRMNWKEREQGRCDDLNDEVRGSLFLQLNKSGK